VSLKEGNKGGQAAKVSRLVADQSVIVEDTELDPKGKLVKYQRLECPELDVDNEEGVVHAGGPGLLRILQRGSEEPGIGQPAAAPQPARPGADDELKLTRVLYSGRMYANDKTHTAIFTDNVHVVHVPSDDINLEPNIDKLPENGLYLRTDRLEVYSRQDASATKAGQQMKATGHCFFKAHDTQSQDNWGRAEVITYDESKDQVILFGGQGGGLAHVYQEKVKGTTPKEITAEKIIYLRKTGAYEGIGTRGVQSQ
jgi:lipopolysaccharide export system protein LptA